MKFLDNQCVERFKIIMLRSQFVVTLQAQQNIACTGLAKIRLLRTLKWMGRDDARGIVLYH